MPLAVAVASGAAAGLTPAVQAQDSTAPAAPEKMEKVVVTGSSIPTAVDAIPAAPVEIVGAAAIEKSGGTDVLDVLKKVSASFSGNGNLGKTLNNGGYGEANVAVRNLSTLVLLDGRRLANSAFSKGSAVDLNSIPLSMIDRIEVLKDGASSIYGADAIGGVVNIITKKDYNGAEISGRYGFATGDGSYNEYQASIVGGASNEKTSITLGASYYHNDPLLTKDRPDPAALNAEQLQDRGVAVAPSYYSPSYPGRVDNYILAGSPFAVGAPGYNPSVTSPPVLSGGPYTSVAAYNAAALTQLGYTPYLAISSAPAGQTINGTAILNTTDFGTYSIQEQNRRNFFSNFKHSIFENGKLDLFAQFLYANVTSIAELAPSPVPYLGPYNIAVPANNPYNPFGIALGAYGGAGSPRVRSRFVDIGNRIFDSESEYYKFVGGLKGEISERYSWEGAYNFNRSDATQYTRNAVNGAALNSALQPLLDANGKQVYNAQGQPLSQLTDAFNGGINLPVYNIFGLPGSNSPDTLNALRTTLYESGVSDLWSVDGHINGQPFDLPAGPFQFAAGFQYIDESLSLSYDGLTQNNLVPGLNAVGNFPGGKRQRWAGYAEVRIPVFSPEKNIPGFHAFEIDASGRYESLNPGGDSAVPKVGFNWKPVDDQVTLRGTYSEGYIAPSVYSLYGPTQTSNPNATIGGQNGQIQVSYPSNPNLPPSQSYQFTGGIVFQPKCVPGLTLSAEYYHIAEDGTPYNPGPNDMINDLNQFGSASQWAAGYRTASGGQLTTTAPNQITLANFGTLVVPTLPGGGQKTDGFDFTVSYRKPTETAGTFTVWGNANLLNSYQFRAGPGAPWWRYDGYYTDTQLVTGANGNLPDFQVNTGLSWEYQNFTFTTAARYIPSVTDLGDSHPGAGGYIPNDYTLNGNPWKIDSWYSVDLQVAYAFKSDAGNKWYDGTRVAFGVNNVTDNLAPLIPSSSEDNTDKATYDIIGRFIYFQVSKKF